MQPRSLSPRVCNRTLTDGALVKHAETKRKVNQSDVPGPKHQRSFKLQQVPEQFGPYLPRSCAEPDARKGKVSLVCSLFSVRGVPQVKLSQPCLPALFPFHRERGWSTLSHRATPCRPLAHIRSSTCKHHSYIASNNLQSTRHQQTSLQTPPTQASTAQDR